MHRYDLVDVEVKNKEYKDETQEVIIVEWYSEDNTIETIDVLFKLDSEQAYWRNSFSDTEIIEKIKMENVNIKKLYKDFVNKSYGKKDFEYINLLKLDSSIESQVNIISLSMMRYA